MQFKSISIFKVLIFIILNTHCSEREETSNKISPLKNKIYEEIYSCSECIIYERIKEKIITDTLNELRLGKYNHLEEHPVSIGRLLWMEVYMKKNPSLKIEEIKEKIKIGLYLTKKEELPIILDLFNAMDKLDIALIENSLPSPRYTHISEIYQYLSSLSFHNISILKKRNKSALGAIYFKIKKSLDEPYIKKIIDSLARQKKGPFNPDYFNKYIDLTPRPHKDKEEKKSRLSDKIINNLYNMVSYLLNTFKIWK